MLKKLPVYFLTFLFVLSCKTVPFTGRKGLKMLSSAEVNQMSFQQYDEVISSSQLSSNYSQRELVSKVGQNIQHAVESYLNTNGHSELIAGYDWEFNLIESPEVNAWCMPGGKVAFYTGILPICQDETGIAVVMGHEIAHAIAEHGNERMSHGLVQQLGGMALQVALEEKPEETKQLAYMAFGLGSHYGAILPFSRMHESEADELGLYFMAMAGYDPQEAPKFWERMKAKSGGNAPPEFMSTHPASSTRINDLNSHMPKALEYYNKAK